MPTTFRKGDKVTLLQNWDSRGTVRAVDLIVYSCGARQMILVDERGEKFEGRNFLPFVKQVRPEYVGNANVFQPSVAAANEVHPRLSADERTVKGLALAELVLAAERALFADRIERWGDNLPFRKSIEASIAALHEARVEHVAAVVTDGGASYEAATNAGLDY